MTHDERIATMQYLGDRIGYEQLMLIILDNRNEKGDYQFSTGWDNATAAILDRLENIRAALEAKTGGPNDFLFGDTA